MILRCAREMREKWLTFKANNAHQCRRSSRLLSSDAIVISSRKYLPRASGVNVRPHDGEARWRGVASINVFWRLEAVCRIDVRMRGGAHRGRGYINMRALASMV